MADDKPYIDILTAEDVTQDILDEALEIADGWYADTNIDWEDLLDRLERHSPWDFGQDPDSPAIRKIKRYVRSQRN